MQGSRLDAAPAFLFEGEDQVRYEEIRELFKTEFAELERVTETEDQQREGTYTGTEKILDSLLELNKDYLRIAAPRFMSFLTRASGPKVSSRS